MRMDKRLSNAINEILASYGKHPEIQGISRSTLPVKESIIALAKDIQVLLFPGLLRQESLEPLDLPYIIGQKTVSIFHRMRDYMEQVLCWDLMQGEGDCSTNEDFTAKVREIAMAFIEELPQMREVLAEDVEGIFGADPAARSRREIVLAYPGIQALSIHRIAHFLYNKGIPLLPRIMSEYIHSETGIDIHPGAQLGKGTMIDHGTGIVIGETAVIKNHVRLYQGVTLGALNPTRNLDKLGSKRHPTIEDDVVIYAGATILGGDTVIGKGAIIGGNVWLTHSIPPHSRIYLEKPMSSNIP